MKYFTGTLKYIKSNPILWVAFLIAACAMSLVVDAGAVHNVIDTFENGSFSAGLTEWVCLFLPINTRAWWTLVLSFVAYIVLVLDLALACAAIDRHMRYNSLSPKGLFSSINNNLMPCTLVMLVSLILCFICGVMLAAIMKATCIAEVSGLYILGIILCAALALVVFYVATFFSLWLPCYIIAGFHTLEALSYAYSLGAQRRRPLFLSMFIPTLIIGVVTVPLLLFTPIIVAKIVVSLLFAALFIYICALIFVVYLDADGIAREDLKKF